MAWREHAVQRAQRDVPVGRAVAERHAHAPWSRANAPVLAIPKRADMVTLVLDDLPRSNPWRLDAGREALHAARAATERALDMPIGESVVRLSVNGRAA